MARAGRRPRRLHRHPVGAARSPAPGRRPGRARSEHDARPARVRAGRHLPVRPALRLQRVLQVLQERREPRIQVHPGRAPHATTTGRSATSRASSPSARRSSRRCHRPSTAPGCATTSRASRPRWTGSSTRSGRRRTARSSAISQIVRIPLDVYRARNATSRALARARASTTRWPRTPVFLLGDSAIGSPYFQSISLGLECAFFLAGHIANRDLSVERDVRSLRGVHVPAVAACLHAHADDQAQQGPARVGRRHDLGLLAKLHIY